MLYAMRTCSTAAIGSCPSSGCSRRDGEKNHTQNDQGKNDKIQLSIFRSWSNLEHAQQGWYVKEKISSLWKSSSRSLAIKVSGIKTQFRNRSNILIWIPSRLWYSDFLMLNYKFYYNTIFIATLFIWCRSLEIIFFVNKHGLINNSKLESGAWFHERLI